MKKLFWIFLSSLAAPSAPAEDFCIASFTRDGTLVVSNAFTNGVVTVLRSSTPGQPWAPEKNVFSVCSVTQLNVTLSGAAGFFRALAVDLTGEAGFSNFTQSYGLLTTIAGSGNFNCRNACIAWEDSFEGGPATNATLSRPHIAMADRAGNVYIADKEAHAIRKVTPDGMIHTVAGINLPGYGTTNPAPATSVALDNPNGLWVREDGSFYILDTGNGLVRKVDTNGIMTAVVDNGAPLVTGGGRGLWVSPDESVLYFCDFTQLKCWDTTNGLTVFPIPPYVQIGELGNLAVDPTGHLAVTDLRANRVYRVEDDGSWTIIAGNGSFGGGGDGQLATVTGLDQVRAIWFLPSGAFYLGTAAGAQVWYVDTDGYIHLLLDGDFYAHAGDGAWFYDQPSLHKVGDVRQITMGYEGNLLITENDVGYVRKISFQRLGF